MPRHYETAQALRYVERLRALRVPPLAGDADAFGFNEARATSHGALYHPWLHSADRRGDARDAVDLGGLAGAATTRALPADGFATGVLAARASDRGAWIAAANAPMRDVVALATRVPASERQALQDAQVNLVRDDPRGFLALSADTLAHEDALLPINVRRLLILLRRLALRRGTGYVFEPNGPMLRRAIQRGFDLLLGELYARGAFAGATPAQAFRVVTDEGINTPAGVEAGRLFVELRVAPSLPMRFIAVRLAQSGERLSVSEEL
jgi:phage tail sheath protein FI